MLPLSAAGAEATGDTTMSSTQHQLIEQCATRLRGIVEALDNIHDTSPHRWSTDLDDVHSSAESLLAMIKDHAPPSEDQLIATGLSYPLAKGLAGTPLRDAPASVEQAGRDVEPAPCPFCGGEVDPTGWLRGDGTRGPECNYCGATARSMEAWQTRTALAQPEGGPVIGCLCGMPMSEGHHSPAGCSSLEEFATHSDQAQHSVPDGYRLIRLEHFAAIKAQLNPEQVDAYRGRNIYDEDKVYANWNACRSALDEIKDVFQQIDWDAENELAELLAAAPGKEVPQAWHDVQAERRRQIEAEGWTPEHDDAHSHGQMARAAACYALAGSSAPNDGTAALLVSLAWPWDEQWWKPSTARRDMVKACALGLAEIERLDRVAASQGGPSDA